MALQSLTFSLVDVFAHEPLSGNGLALFLLDAAVSARAMQRITQEMRQFESIFLCPTQDPHCFHARIFTMEEELPFAGHPIIGAAACLHAQFFADAAAVAIQLLLPTRSVNTCSRRVNGEFFAEMDQGKASVNPPLGAQHEAQLLSALNLSVADKAPNLPLQVISTGLPYLIVPIQSNLAQARIVIPDFEALLANVGAQFVYVLDVAAKEGRTWDNAGRVEDIATGSAVGPAAAYLVVHGLAEAESDILIHQGRFLQRPSQLFARVSASAPMQVQVSGQVCMVGSGTLRLPASVL